MTDRPYKQVLLYRRDLNMRKGKIAAQCAHASISVFLQREVPAPAGLDPARAMVLLVDPAMLAWARHGQAKIVLSVDDEAALVRAHALAREAGLPTALIRDAGHTEFGGVPTLTACAIGPARIEDIDPITGPGGVVATKLA
ncbi:aminoacyl-tRNA hydrolase [Myxococcota bacterium]|nr:aminoacyl-tRNA hydrolase [Myxococcota bacterium]